MADVVFDHATRHYDGVATPAVHDLSLSVENGEFMVLVGPSGSGKTTALRMLAGLEPVDSGSIKIGQQDVTNVRPQDRDIAIVFPSYALYPHMTARQNIGFHLRVKRIVKAEINRRVDEVAQLLEPVSYTHLTLPTILR